MCTTKGLSVKHVTLFADFLRRPLSVMLYDAGLLTPGTDVGFDKEDPTLISCIHLLVLILSSQVEYKYV